MDEKQLLKNKEWSPWCAGAAEPVKSDVSDSASTLTTLSPHKDPLNKIHETEGNDSKFKANCSSTDERYSTQGNNSENNNETETKEDGGFNNSLHKYVQKEIFSINGWGNDIVLENPTPACSSCITSPSMNEEESSISQKIDNNAVREPIRTRLRSGSISPISYSSLVSMGRSFNFSREKGQKVGQTDNDLERKPALGKRKTATNSTPIPPKEVLERILKKRTNPPRPCNSYAFFVMANWHAVSYAHPDDSFEEISKKISKIWSQLSSAKKKKFRNLFLRERRRYKKQKEALNLHMDENDLYI